MILPLGDGPISGGGASVGASADVGQASLPLRINVGPTGNAALALRIDAVDAEIASGSATVTDRGVLAAVWGIVVELDGVDVSDSIVGEVVVEAEESAARIAEFSLHQPHGTVISPTEWTGKGVRIWLSEMSTGYPLNPLPLFFGIIDLPIVKPRTGLISLRCTDNRQGVVGGMSKEAIAALILGSRWSPVVFSDGATSWEYANDRISTIPAALDLSPVGELRVTDWAAKAVADLSFDEDQILEQSIDYTAADRIGMVNQVDINFGYRFPRVKAEGYLVSYDFIELNDTSFVYWIRDNNSLLQRAAVVAALEAAGASVVEISYIGLPTTPQVIPGTGGDPAGVWLPNPAVDGQYCLGFSAVVSFDYAQQTEEEHYITVSNAWSIETIGVVRDEMSGALEGIYDDTVAVEQNILMYRQQMTTIPPKNLAPIVVGLTNSVNGTLTTDSDRDAANAAMECLIAVANTRIYAAHRRHVVSAAIPCNPVLDVDKTVSVDAQGVVAEGKVRRVVHKLNPDNGSATSTFELAICSVAGIGITHLEDAVTAPAGTSDGTSNTLEAPEVIWNGLLGEDNVITITFPGVLEAERAKALHSISSSYAAPIHEDLIEVML